LSQWWFGAAGIHLVLDTKDCLGGHAAFAHLRGVGVGVGEEEFAEDGEGFGARDLEEGVEGEGRGGHAWRMASGRGESSEVRGLCAQVARKEG